MDPRSIQLWRTTKMVEKMLPKSTNGQSSWWFQPSWKIFVKLGHFPQGSGWKQKIFETTTQLIVGLDWWFGIGSGFCLRDNPFHKGILGGPNHRAPNQQLIIRWEKVPKKKQQPRNELTKNKISFPIYHNLSTLNHAGKHGNQRVPLQRNLPANKPAGQCGYP